MDQTLKTLKGALPGLISFALVVGGIVVTFRYFTVETIQIYIESAGLWAPLILIIAKASTIVVAPLGGSPLYPLAGALFGFWEGLLYLLIGDALGGTVSFYLSRLYGRRIVNYFFPDNKLIDRVLHVLGSLKGLIVAQIAFISFPELVSYAAGLTRIPFIPFFLVFMLISTIPRAILVAVGTLLTDANSSWIFLAAMVAGGIICFGSILVFARYVRLHNPDLSKDASADRGTMGF